MSNDFVRIRRLDDPQVHPNVSNYYSNWKYSSDGLKTHIFFLNNNLLLIKDREIRDYFILTKIYSFFFQTLNLIQFFDIFYHLNLWVILSVSASSVPLGVLLYQ